MADKLWKEAVNDLVLVPNVWVTYLVLVRNVLGKLVRPSNEVPKLPEVELPKVGEKQNGESERRVRK